MDYADEAYVRVYVRDTKTWLRLEFEGQCLLLFLLRKLDKAGVLDGIDEPESDVALLTNVPLKIVRVGLARLLKWEVFKLVGSRLVMPNYIEAQNAVRTDKARQRDAREKRRAKACLVTKRDKKSRAVTRGHARSRSVTLYCTDLHSADLHSADPEQALEEHAPCQDPAVELVFSPTAREPERAALVAPRPKPGPIPDGAGTSSPTWDHYPEGWHWNAETEARARMEGVSPAELQEHVNWWTTHNFSRRVNNLDGELRRCIGGIRAHAESVRAKAAQASVVTPFRPRRAAPALAQPNCGMTGLEGAIRFPAEAAE